MQPSFQIPLRHRFHLGRQEKPTRRREWCRPSIPRTLGLHSGCRWNDTHQPAINGQLAVVLRGVLKERHDNFHRLRRQIAPMFPQCGRHFTGAAPQYCQYLLFSWIVNG